MGWRVQLQISELQRSEPAVFRPSLSLIAGERAADADNDKEGGCSRGVSIEETYKDAAGYK